MASCMTLKRSFEHDRDSPNNNNNSFESRTSSSSTKRRRRCFPMTVVSSPTTMASETTESTTVFPDVQPIVTTDDLLNRIKEEVRRLQRRHQLKVSTSSDLNDDDNLNECRSSTNQHLLTLKQVNIICARLLKEREDKIREEYDRILSYKVNEQYEGFVRFTQDQLARRFSELQFSYVS
ncbi:unnamed protein product [Rotaria sp. Silwood2]|nr:unnamed protein product [Rotaria sp. Silwood2]CAF2562925.1 unnamed protein product [Rotaria sp. Silwood2]CAF2753031.1 unnamed protein product [Rotaria sp. Silwood2]CAF2967880.1 unnamed protein product [Rotaria sp. Silwood2]CAF3858461.1 unnamed protein product [Rotaria sp. Silwood2]